MNTPLKAPFPWFGGKRKVAPQVWAALGDVDTYVEPFCGSLAVLFGRPPSPRDKLAETINDADGFVSNFWRALTHDPESVAYHADYPVVETDLLARHLWLVNTGRSRLLNSLEADPDYYDAQIAGWWVWGICAWIGSGWCAGTGPWMTDNEGIVRKRPHIGRGVNRQLPYLGSGRGVNRQLPYLGDNGNCENRSTGIFEYFVQLANRLRDVRVCNGDWSRVVTNGALSYGSTKGVFLDPPYLGDVRTADLYTVDDHTIAHAVREWCLANGDRTDLRIVLAGYSTEHDHLMPDTWRREYWTAGASYATAASAARQDGNHKNRTKECLWMSPGCLRKVGPAQER